MTLKLAKGTVFIIAFLALAITIMMSYQTNSSRIENWATDHEYTVIECEACFIDYGPFYYKTDEQMIYRVVLRDRKENDHIAYFRIGWGIEHAWEE